MKRRFALEGGLAAVRSEYQARYRFNAGPWTPEAVKKVDTEFARRVGAAFEALPEYSPAAHDAYAALARETLIQADFLESAGYTFGLWRGTGEPYKNSDEMRLDLHATRHLFILPTAGSFGQSDFEHHFYVKYGHNIPVEGRKWHNPLLEWDTQRSTMKHPVLINDLFRWVHDCFGHGIEPHQFGPIGEENAYREHMTMFSPLAQRALTVETRAQNCWVNFGPHIVRAYGSVPRKGEADYIKPCDRPFGVQKFALLPEWCMEMYYKEGVNA